MNNFNDNFSLMGFEPEPSQNIFSPKITGPSYNEQFNSGIVSLTWDENNSPGIVEFDINKIFYELEYTNKFDGRDTIWISINKRIPYGTSSYEWKTGKAIKSNSVRIRIRTKTLEQEIYSNWSISEQFSVNVFKIVPPVILSPVQNGIYYNYINIILDDKLLKNTFHQKVRYTFEYMSFEQEIEWTPIYENIPFGKNLIRWNISSLNPSTDYVLKMTVKNSSTCLEASEENPDQFCIVFVYGINIKQPGMFIVDTKPPQSLLEIDGRPEVTNQLEHNISIYASDMTTQVETIRLRECDANSILALGNLEDPYDPTGGCKNISEILSNLDQFGKEIEFSSKVFWKFEDKSGLKKLEAILKDSGGNLSIDENSRTFINIYNQTQVIADFIIVSEQRDNVIIDTDTNPPSIVVEPSVFEVVYLGTDNGMFYVLEPYSRLLYQINDESIKSIIELNSTIYLFTYNESLDYGYFRRHDGADSTIIYTFEENLSLPKCAIIFDNNIYVGLENGQLWEFNGTTLSNINTYLSPISKMNSDTDYLYISFENSTTISLYDGSSFTALSL